ncbi:MAG: hypothetical protein E7676_07120 [Ruminococcaceae bacterium]|nr:hypothetical protein [Oscillospiraceae bacterium]
MNKQEFIDKYSIGDSVPADPTSKLVHASALAEAIEQFIDERFRAAAEVTNRVSSNERVLICDEYTAYFFKTLFASVFGRVYLCISIEEQREKITFSITSSEPLPLSKKETDIIIKTARNAGMIVESVDGGIFASLEFVDERQFSVYAANYADGKGTIIKRFEEMFFGSKN